MLGVENGMVGDEASYLYRILDLFLYGNVYIKYYTFYYVKARLPENKLMNKQKCIVIHNPIPQSILLRINIYTYIYVYICIFVFCKMGLLVDIFFLI